MSVHEAWVPDMYGKEKFREADMTQENQHESEWPTKGQGGQTRTEEEAGVGESQSPSEA